MQNRASFRAGATAITIESVATRGQGSREADRNHEMPDSRNTTLNDVAEAAGVSYQTVSRVINDHPHVAAGTRRRVLKAIKQLGYQPNAAARQLVTGRSNMIGIVSFGLGYYGPSQMVLNIESALRSHGFGLIVTTINELADNELATAVQNLRSQRADGLVLITPLVEMDVEKTVDLLEGLRYVMIDVEQQDQVPSIAIDQAYGSRLATRHLIDLGHRSLAEISGPLRWYDARSRHQGWLEMLAEAGLEPGLQAEGDWTARGGYEAARQLLRDGLRFTGLVVANDQMALGAIHALREHGFRIPEDVSVTGFDDVPEAAFFQPPLTTVRQDFTALGQQSVAYLVSLLEDPSTPLHQRVLYPTLIPRRSTAEVP